MAYLCVDPDGTEWIFDSLPLRNEVGWIANCFMDVFEQLKKGTIRKLIGKSLKWRHEPVELT